MIRPILFNTDMVKAILDGRKTVTRRCVKAKSKNACGFYVTFRKSDNAFMGVYDYDKNEMRYDNQQTWPAYPGDILYVRETWHKYIKRVGYGENCHLHEFYGYEASMANAEDAREKWKPSIHMPKEAARIFLRVTDVQMERLKDMTLDDFLAEGVRLRPKMFHDPENAYMQAQRIFAGLWDSTVNKEQRDLYGWDANPWVWVIAFERCEKPEGWCV